MILVSATVVDPRTMVIHFHDTSVNNKYSLISRTFTMFFQKAQRKIQLTFYYSTSIHSFKPTDFQQINTTASFFVAI